MIHGWLRTTKALTHWRRFDFAITHSSHRPQPKYTRDYCKSGYFRVINFSHWADQKHIRGFLNSRCIKAHSYVMRYHITRIKSEIIKAQKARKTLGKLNWAIQLSSFLSFFFYFSNNEVRQNVYIYIKKHFFLWHYMAFVMMHHILLHL